MSNLMDCLSSLQSNDSKVQFLEQVRQKIVSAGYQIAESDTQKPWGAFFRIQSKQADMFIQDFPFGVTTEEARLGIAEAELSPKILVVLPGQRLSWQYHNRRAERWVFLTPGAYRRSLDDIESERFEASAGEVVQFGCNERHRLEGMPESIVLVAEIWQHSNPNAPSNEEDIVHLADDYKQNLTLQS